MIGILRYDAVSVVTFSDVPAGIGFVPGVLKAVANAEINIDMISQTPPKSDRFTFGFSFSDEDIPTLLTVMGKITSVHNITPFVNSGNVKLIVKSSEMADQAGFAAKVFEACENISAQVLLVTTGVDEISLLVPESSADELSSLLAKIVGF